MWIARHGQTEWSLSGQHTGTTDLELTDDGVDQARALGARLSDVAFTCVLTSPYKGARHTAELAGVAEALQIDDDLGEMRYGMARAVPPRRCWVDITQLARHLVALPTGHLGILAFDHGKPAIQVWSMP